MSPLRVVDDELTLCDMNKNIIFTCVAGAELYIFAEKLGNVCYNFRPPSSEQV